MSVPPASLQEQKRRLRADMRAKRAAEAETNNHSFKALTDVFLSHVKLEGARVIASYCAFRDEMDPGHLTESLRAKGYTIALPVIPPHKGALSFRLYERGDRLTANAMGVLEPVAGAPEAVPDVLFVPLLAFDNRRNRLGYGGGYYDRTIAGLRLHKTVWAIGFAYACQQIDQVPVGPHDIPMDKIVTELNVF